VQGGYNFEVRRPLIRRAHTSIYAYT
jgi:hypothetical protein